MFPRPAGEKGSDGRRHVPTLVLHGQRRFSLERWSSASTQPRQNLEGKEAVIADDADEAMGIRGGGGECSSQDSTNETSAAEQATTESNKRGKHTSAEKKRPCLTFEGRALKLPNTPKRQKRRKEKSPLMNNVKNARRGNTNGCKKARESSIVEVIVIDSDSEDEPQLEITAKNTVAH